MSYYSSSKFTLISNLLTFHNLKKKNDSAGFSSLTLLNNTVIAGHTFICEISIFFLALKGLMHYRSFALERLNKAVKNLSQ